MAYKVNETTLETFTASKRAAAKAAGGPVSDLIGIDILKSVKSFSGMTLNYIWFYQVPHINADRLDWRCAGVVVVHHVPKSKVYHRDKQPYKTMI